MINGINPIGVKNLTNIHLQPAFKASDNEVKPVTVPELKVKSDGMTELSNYNKSMVYKVPNLEVEPLIPIVLAPDKIEAIEGERIYDSKGQLHAIIDNNEDLKTIYKILDGNVYLVTKVDNSTGKTVYQQSYGDDGTCFVSKYNPQNGDMTNSSFYDEKGELVDSSKYLKKHDGTELAVSKDKRGYTVWEQNETVFSSMHFDENKKLKSIEQLLDLGNRTVRNEKRYYKGNLISNHSEETNVIPNAFMQDILKDPEFKPAQKLSTDFDFKGHQGEKTYYSNGALESNTVMTSDGKTKAEFNPDGSLNKISYGNLMYEFKENGGQVIHEYLDDKTEKITEYYGGLDSHESHVVIKTPEGEKTLCCDKDGKIRYYWDDVNKTDYSFTNGMLENVW